MQVAQVKIPAHSPEHRVGGRAAKQRKIELFALEPVPRLGKQHSRQQSRKAKDKTQVHLRTVILLLASILPLSLSDMK